MASQPIPPEEAPVDIPVPTPTDPEPFVPTDPVMRALPEHQDDTSFQRKLETQQRLAAS